MPVGILDCDLVLPLGTHDHLNRNRVYSRSS
jgi:hypothetical protein